MAVGTEKKESMLSRNNQRYTSSTVRTWIGWFTKVVFLFNLIWWSLMKLSSFKSYGAKRFKSLLKVRPSVKRIVGLTGTPSSNGLMDLWAEFRILDLGQRLGRCISHYRRYLLHSHRKAMPRLYFHINHYPVLKRNIYQTNIRHHHLTKIYR